MNTHSMNNPLLVPPQLLEDIKRLHANVEAITKPILELQRKFTPGIEQLRRVQEASSAGFVPHTLLTKYFEKGAFKNVTSEELASQVWPDLRPRLHLSLQRCLIDQRLFQTFSEMLNAHDQGYFQLIVPSGTFVIERVANITQTSEQKANPERWFKDHFGELSLSDLPEWRGWTILVQHVFEHCWDDETADQMKFLESSQCCARARITTIHAWR